MEEKTITAIDVKSPILHACGGALYRILPETESDQIHVSHSGENLSEVLARIDHALGGETNMRFVANIASRNELANISPGDRVYVVDASADPTVPVGNNGAMYIYLPSYEWALIGAYAPQQISDFVKDKAGIDVHNNRMSVAYGDGLSLTASGVLYNNSPSWNTEIYINSSRTFVCPYQGFYEVTCIAGGNAGRFDAVNGCVGGDSGQRKVSEVFLEQGEEVEVIVGAGGLSMTGLDASETSGTVGGQTSFGEISSASGHRQRGASFPGFLNNQFNSSLGIGGGEGGGYGVIEPSYFGAGGGSYWHKTAQTTPISVAGFGGAVILRYHNPNKYSGGNS